MSKLDLMPIEKFVQRWFEGNWDRARKHFSMNEKDWDWVRFQKHMHHVLEETGEPKKHKLLNIKIVKEV